MSFITGSQKPVKYFTLTAEQISNQARDHPALLPRQILAVTCYFPGPTHHDVNLIAPLRHPQFDPLIHV